MFAGTSDIGIHSPNSGDELPLPRRKKAKSRLFAHIEKSQGNRPWGRILDAGTGRDSIDWIAGLDSRDWTAVTASKAMAGRVRATVRDRARPCDRVVVGNWMDEDLLNEEHFDTVLLDYFIGAIEGYSPYWQERLFERMHPLVAGRLYITGVEPYVPFPAATGAGRLVQAIGSLRDACLLLAGERPYREFPLDWVRQQLLRARFRILEARHFPIIYREKFVNGQLDMCLDLASRFASRSVAATMQAHTEELRQQALSFISREGGLRHGADYVVVATPHTPAHREPALQ